MDKENITDEDLRRFLCQEVGGAREEFGHFCEPIHDHHDGIVAFAAGQSNDEINAQRVLGACLLLQGLE